MSAQPLELWGGLECSVVRIGDTWRDQVQETGHHDRTGDLDRIAALGLGTLRYPLVWERCQSGTAGWAWHDRQMAQLRRLGITPVAGLIHHGAGPEGTGIAQPGFADGLAAHAGMAARRYPWVEWWVPVNEPQTTARFSFLYGHWYPHLRDEGAFLRAVVTQCRAALEAMRAVRAHSHHARFVHTEDIGRTFATPKLRRQADHENSRRWLSLDLLCGRVDHAHPWRAELRKHGVTAGDLDELATGEATPDLLGINYYVTSDRFLDHRLDLYPRAMQGGNSFDAYVDTEAARVDLPANSTGWRARLSEAWQRYRLPMAVTEAHLGCDHPREQLRWLMEAWTACLALREEGVAIRAVTAWALLGLMDWDSLLRERRQHYEPGVFDVGRGPLRPTLLADAVATLTQEGKFTHPALLTTGWWHRKDRVHEQLRWA